MYKRRPRSFYPSNRYSMAFLEFFPAAARAGIVSSDFGSVAFGLVRRSGITIAGLLRHDEFGAFAFLFDLLGLLLFLNRLEEEEEPQRVFLDAIHEIFKQSVRFLLVLDQRIALSVTAEADAFLQ